MTPMSVTKTAGGKDYLSPFIGPVDHTQAVRLDVSAMTTDEVDTKGYLKPGVPLTRGGILASKTGHGIVRAVVAGAAAGDVTVTGIATEDELIAVLHYAGAGTDVTDVADLTAEFTISAADTINNDGGTGSGSGKLLVIYRDVSAERAAKVFGLVYEATKVADSNATADLNAASDVDVVVATICQVNRDAAEDNLGRALTAAELNNMPGSIVVSET